MKKVAVSLCAFLMASTFVGVHAESSVDNWVGTWSSKSGSNALLKSISIVRDQKDIKLKFAGSGSANGGYLGEGIAEWYPDNINGGAYVTDFAKDGSRMHVVVVPRGKNRIQTSIYTKYDDGRTNSFASQAFTRTKTK